MNDRRKTILSLSTLALLGLTLTCDVYASTNRSECRAIEQVCSCVSEIAKHAIHDDATRALHLVKRVNQTNLVELEIHIETIIYAADGEPTARKYKTSCLIAGLGNLVDFWIDESELNPDAENQEI